MDTSADPDLSVIIVSHGHESMLRPCVASLCPAFAGLSAEVILVDNLDRGQIAACVANLAVPMRIINNLVPRGLAQNVNDAAAVARGRYLLILNPDTRLHSGNWRELIDFLARNENVGLAGCCLLDPDGSPQQSFRRFPSLDVAILRALAVDRWPWQPGFYLESIMRSVRIDRPTEVDWVFGACMLLSRSAFDRVGGMDTDYRLYYEDVDLCYRLRLRGLTTVVLPQLVLFHEHQRTSAKRPFGQQWRWHAASLVRFFRKHGYWINAPIGATAAAQPNVPRAWQ